MELYILDALLRREIVVDQFESLIWTERFNSAGDFELVVQSTPGNRGLFTTGKWLALNASFRCMVVEIVEDGTDDSGREILKVSGTSIEQSLLENRTAFNVRDDLVTNPKWVITDQPADVARKLFHDICVTGILDPMDVLPFVTAVAILPDDTIPEPADAITAEFEPGDLYTAIKSICEPYDLGFRLIRNYDLSQLAFDIYAGSDRTSQQVILPAVIFSPDLENLDSVTRLESTTGAKNIAYVYSNLGFEEVVALDVDPNTAGFERQVLTVKMDDIDVGTSAPVVTALMQQKGKEELAKYRNFIGFDGQVSNRTAYVYGVDYQLGDLVEMHGKDGDSSIVRVTEQIFAADGEGERAYPTLSNRSYVSLGSWLGQTTLVWYDYDDEPTTYWSSMP